jgi:hypothetical protein
MSEEQQGGFFSQLKNQVIAGAGVALTTIGGFFMDEVKGILGISEEEEGGAKTEMVQEQKQEVNVTGPEIIINIPEQKPAETKTIIKEVPAKQPVKKKEKEELLDW